MAALGSTLDLDILKSDGSSNKSAGPIAKDRGWPSSSVRQRVAALNRRAPRDVGGKQQLLTTELLDEIREFIEEDIGRISMSTAAIRFTLSRTCSRKAIRFLRVRPLGIRAVLDLEDPSQSRSSQVRRGDAWEVGACIWKAHLEEDRN